MNRFVRSHRKLGRRCARAMQESRDADAGQSGGTPNHLRPQTGCRLVSHSRPVTGGLISSGSRISS
ncbi:MAG: hypothetical protein DWQ29_11250, partial [Planctomycetota bacterium]